MDVRRVGCGDFKGYMGVRGKVIRTITALSVKPEVVQFTPVSKRGIFFRSRKLAVGRGSRGRICTRCFNGNAVP